MSIVYLDNEKGMVKSLIARLMGGGLQIINEFFFFKKSTYLHIFNLFTWVVETNELFICDSVQEDETIKSTHGQNKEKRANGEKP